MTTPSATTIFNIINCCEMNDKVTKLGVAQALREAHGIDVEEVNSLGRAHLDVDMIGQRDGSLCKDW